MLRVGGALLLLAGALLFAIDATAAEQKKLRLLEGLLLLVRHIRREIEGPRTPMPQILSSFTHGALEECGFLPVLREAGLAAALCQCREMMPLSGEEMRTLSGFAATLGRSGAKGQVELCDRTAAELERSLAKRREEVPRRTRVLQTLSISGALMLLLLLL